MDNPLKKLGEEWKKASPKEKLMIAGAAASIAAIALYLHNKTSSSAPGTGLAGLPSNLSTPGTGGTGTTGTPTGTTGTTGNNPVEIGSPLFPTGDTGSFYAPPPYTGTGTVDTNTPMTSYSTPAGSVLSGTFGRSTATQLAHQGATPLNLPAYSPGAAVQGGTFGRTSATQNAHRGTSPTPPAPTPNPFGTGYAPRIAPQPTITTVVYAGTRHAPSAAPVSTQQAPPVTKKAQAV